MVADCGLANDSPGKTFSFISFVSIFSSGHDTLGVGFGGPGDSHSG